MDIKFAISLDENDKVKVNMFLLNDEEAMQLTGENDLNKIADIFLSKGVWKNISPHMARKNKVYLLKSLLPNKNFDSGTLVAWGFLCAEFLTPAQESAKS